MPRPPSVEIQPLCRDMIPEFRALHKILFPVQYGDKFYDDVLRADMHLALVAVADVEQSDQSLGTPDSSVHNGTGSKYDGGHSGRKTETGQLGGCGRRRQKVIVGVASGRVKSIPGMWRDRRDGYIMTLGTREGYRGQGIANLLLNELMRQLSERYSANSFSLHCTTDNTAAIALYQKNLFVVVRKLVAHYHFHGKHHDAFELVLEPRSMNTSYCSCHVM